MWTVLSFPILVDIYAEPIVSELMNVYPVGAPTISIPKVEIKATVTTFDTVSGVPTPVVYTLPDNRNSVRPGFITDVVAGGTIHNFYTSLGGGANDIDPEKMIMNRRYTMVTQVTVTQSGGNPNVVQQITIRPDNRSQLLSSFVFTNAAAEDVLCSITGHVNYEKGTAQINGIFEKADGSGAPSLTHTLQDATFSLKFTPTHTMAGRTKVTISTELTDITIDQCGRC